MEPLKHDPQDPQLVLPSTGALRDAHIKEEHDKEFQIAKHFFNMGKVHGRNNHSLTDEVLDDLLVTFRTIGA